ncbi:MAG TPA: Dot/Icm T4SS effector Zinc-dependent metalloprotease LegP [Propionibacteriaceae bacterium]|nr:Dot/Icm T4SS effector Zinc-dependent metalloprotease LegP [Propionibacteriaceae bacterium]
MSDDTTTTKSGSSSEGSEHSFPVRNKTVHTALISGVNFHAKPVQYVALDGLAMFEGDIVLGTLEEVAAATDAARAEMSGSMAMAVMISGAQFRWPNCLVPYTIDPALPNQARVTDAIAHWTANTRFTFVLRTAANAASYPDFVTFRPGSGCSSSVGKRGGQQFINLASGCSLGNTIHEIGHTIGLWHEQSREDRDSFVTIHWDKITSGTEHNFNQHISDGDDVGAYDYGSIMHYPRNAFSKDGSDTITPLDPAASIGQRTALSAGDIAAVNSLCPAPGTGIETTKERIETRKELIETAAETLKERIETLKERIETSAETLKERIETAKEPIKEHVETNKEVIETVKEASPETLVETIGGTTIENVGRFPGNVVINPGNVVNPGNILVNPAFGDAGLPFAMVTPYAGAPEAGVTQQVTDRCPCCGQALDGSLEARLASVEELVSLLAAERDAAFGATPQ